MDEKTKLLVSLGAAVAANCVPCFEHFLTKTQSCGLDAWRHSGGGGHSGSSQERSTDHYNEHYSRDYRIRDITL